MLMELDRWKAGEDSMKLCPTEYEKFWTEHMLFYSVKSRNLAIEHLI